MRSYLRPDELRMDVRAALRSARRAPTVAAAAVVVVALALGGLTTMSGLLDALVFRELAVVRRPAELVSMSLIGSSGRRTNVSLPELAGLASQPRSLVGLCGVAVGILLPIETEGTIALNPAALLTPDCFTLLGVSPYRGRLLNREDDPAVGPGRAVVLGYGYWQRQFGGASDVVGRTLTVHGVRLSIVGVTPPGFTGLGVELDTDIMLPVGYDQTGPPDPKRPRGVMFAVGRLRPGASLDAARTELLATWPSVRDSTMAPGLTAAQVHDLRALHVAVESFATGSSNLRSQYAQPLKVLTATAVVLLVVACATLAGLLLSHTISRQQEFATRAALGAGRARLARQVFVEAMLPTIAGAGLALPLGWWLRRGITTMIWTGLNPVTLNTAPDWRTGGLTAAAAVVVGTAIGLVPALMVALTPYRLQGNVRHASRATSRLGAAVFVAQLAISVSLVFCSGLLVLSAWRLTHVDLGFRGDDILAARLLPRDNGYAGLDVPAYYEELATDLGKLPGVRSVAYSHAFPGSVINPETVAPRESVPESDDTPVALDIVSPRFFDTTSIGLLQGRDFTSADVAGATPVAIITRRLASRLFPDGAVGRRIRIGREPARADVVVVGVSGDPRLGDVRKPPTPAVFRPLNQELALAKQPIVLLRAVGDPQTLVGPLNQTLASLHREYTAQPLPISVLVGNAVLQERVMSALAAIMGSFVLVLAFAGLFALLTHRVRRRAPELGVRLALGASPSALQWLVSLEALRLVCVGLAIGLPSALILASVTRAVLFDLSASDLSTLATTAVLFVVLGLTAAVLPARRAASVDPGQSLRAL